MERKSGSYWIKVFGQTNWRVAEYDEKSKRWQVCGYEYAANDYIAQINPNRIMSPDEWE